MIIVCPECHTSYAVADATSETAASGRRVRCAHCGHVWHHAPAEGTAEATANEPAAGAEPAANGGGAPLLLTAVAAPEPTEPQAAADAQSSPPALSALPRPSVAAEPPATARRRTVWVAALGAAALAAGLVVAVILGRDRIEALFPSTAAVYAMLHLDAPGAGLKVTVIPIRRADALVISGDIVNDASAPRAVPRLKLTLLDANKIDLVSKVIDPPVARLPPGARAHFNTIFEHPANAAVRVDVTYAAD